MRPFSPIRYSTCPITGELYIQTLLTWGREIKKLYPDFWCFTGASLRITVRNSVCRPVVWLVVETAK